ncbi:MAG: RidA family protein [Candidatus Sumerlaeia bacterium]
MNYEDKLKAMGLELPPVPKPVAAYVPALKFGSMAVTSGQLPVKDGHVAFRGKVLSEVSLEHAQEAARLCCLNALAAIRSVAGSLDRIERIVRLVGYVQGSDDFHDQPKVINGASELLLEVFGEAGRHTRCAIGVNALPLNAAVELDIMVMLKEDE